MSQKRLRIVWTRRARENIRSIRDYVAADSPRGADRIVSGIKASVEQIAQFPMSGSIVPEFEAGTIRETFVASYRIVYRVRERSIEIVTVRHGSRQFDVED